MSYLESVLNLAAVTVALFALLILPAFVGWWGGLLWYGVVGLVVNLWNHGIPPSGVLTGWQDAALALFVYAVWGVPIVVAAAFFGLVETLQQTDG